jgi:hypothetical protein
MNDGPEALRIIVARHFGRLIAGWQKAEPNKVPGILATVGPASAAPASNSSRPAGRKTTVAHLRRRPYDGHASVMP